MQNLIDYAEKKGVEYVELKTESKTFTKSDIENLKVKELDKTYTKQFSVRILHKGKEAIISTTKAPSTQLIDKAIKLAKITEKNLTLQTDENQQDYKEKIKTPYKINPEDISVEQIKNDVLEMNKEYKKHKELVTLKSSYVNISSKLNILTNQNADLEWQDYRSGYYCWAYAKSNEGMENAFEIKRIHGGYEIMKEAPQITEKAIKKAKDLLTAKYAKAGNFPIICDQKLGGVFTHEAVGHACEADAVIKKDTVLHNKLNQKIASSIVTMKDSGEVKGHGWCPFDDEGSKATTVTMIDKGILSNYLQSKETAAILNAKPTGNGRAQSVSCRVIPRMTNTFIENGDSSFDEMISEIKEGYYLCGSSGGEVWPIKGEFIFASTHGYKIENGEKTHMIKNASLIGNILEILPKIKLIAKDLKFNEGMCGKAGQWVPVGDGSPHILIEKATVGGVE